MSGGGRMRRIRGSLTPVQAVALGSIAVAGLLLCIDVGVAGRPFAAVASVLATIGALALAWNLMRTGTMVRAMRRDLTQLAATQVAQPVPPPRPPEPVAPAAPVAEPDQEPDRSQSELLAARRLLNATAGPTTIAMIGSPALAAAVEQRASVQRLHPGMSAAELERARPQALVVEEDALDLTPWAGTTQAHGSALLLELRAAMAAVEAEGGSCYVIASTGQPGPASSGLRSGATVVDQGSPTHAGHWLVAVLAAHRAAASERVK